MPVLLQDVAAHLGVPEDPAAFLRDTCLWTLPVAAVSVPFWRYILASETVAGEVFRNGLIDKDDTLEVLGAAEIFGISALLEIGAGLLFRGTILATVTMAVAGIPSMVQQETPDLYLSSARDIAVHFPTVWMWPFVAVATGAIEASLVQASLVSQPPPPPPFLFPKPSNQQLSQGSAHPHCFGMG